MKPFSKILDVKNKQMGQIYMYMYNRITLLYTWYIVNQLYFN